MTRFARLYGILFLLSQSVLSFGLFVEGNSALTKFSQVSEYARSWHNDAVLTHISSPSVDDKGTAKEWIYEYYSPQLKKWYFISVVGEKVEGIEVISGKTDALGDEFVDSAKVMEIARANGLKGKSPGMSLAVYRFGSDPDSYWMVSGGFETGDVTVFLEAKTGKFFSKTIIE